MNYRRTAAKSHKRPSAEYSQPNLGGRLQAKVKGFGRKMVGRKIIAASSFCHISFCQEFKPSVWRCRILLFMIDCRPLHCKTADFLRLLRLLAVIFVFPILRSPL